MRTLSIPHKTASRILRFAACSSLLVLLVPPLALAASPFDQAWTRHTSDTGLSGADGARLADVDGDVDQDIDVGYEESGVVRIYRNPGTSAATSPWPFVSFSGFSGVEDANLADIDGDGRHDVVVSSEGGSGHLSVIWAPSSPADYWDANKWTTMEITAAAGQDWMFSQALNLDGQNGPDIIAGSKGGGATVSWLKAPADPRVAGDWTEHKITDASWIMSLEPEDMDGDGDKDFLISDRTGGSGRGARWLENPGADSSNQTSEWSSHMIAATTSGAMFLDVADIDDDGLDDVLLTVKGTEWRIAKRLDATGLNWDVYEKTLPVVSPGIGTVKAIRAVDIDGDGHLDVVHSFADATSPKEGMIWLRNPGVDPLTDSWQTGFPVAGPEGSKYDLIQVIDLDGDGDLDLISTEENEGAGSFGLGTIWYENPVPEPSTLALAAFGLLGLIGFGRRRKR